MDSVDRRAAPLQVIFVRMQVVRNVRSSGAMTTRSQPVHVMPSSHAPVLVVFLVSLGLGPAACATTGPAAQPFEEIALSDYVEAQLEADEGLDASKIDVSTENGVVMLKGYVPTEQDKDRAEEIAMRAAGVDQVINALTTNEEYEPPVPPGVQVDSAEELSGS